MKFKNKVVVVTGASRGIGQAICVAFAKAGATVVGVARSNLAETGVAVEKAGGQFIAHNADLGTGTQKESHDVIAQILAKTGQIDVLVNNAGIIRRAPAKDFSEADWNAVMATNLNSPFFLMQAVGKWWIEIGRAKAPEGSRLKLVNIASLLSFQGGITVPAYAASKHGIAGITKSLSNEWAKERINVNAIAPGFVPTKMTSRYYVRPDGTEDEVMKQAVLEPMAKFAPLKRVGTPSDIAFAVLYLAADASSFVTGQVLSPNGGMAMH